MGMPGRLPLSMGHGRSFGLVSVRKPGNLIAESAERCRMKPPHLLA